MSRKLKTVLIVLVSLLLVVLVLFFLVDAVYVPAKEPVEYPTGSLKATIFEEQNNSYTENDGFDQEHVFEKVPYKADLPSGDGAIIGDAAMVYQVTDEGNVFVYFSEYDDSMDVKHVILSQFPATLLISYIPEKTQSLLQVDKKGYINGFAAEYLVMSIEASDGRNISDAVVLGYALDVPEVDYAGKHIFVGVGTTNITTAALENCQVVLDAIMSSVRKDEKLEEEREEEAKRAAEALKDITELKQDLDLPTSDTQQSGFVADDRTTTISIDVETPYNDMVVEVNWTMDNPNAVLELFTPDGSSYYSPSTQDGFGAKFLVDYAQAGTWQLRVLDYLNCGSISTFYSGDPADTSGTTPATTPATPTDTQTNNDVYPSEGGFIDG